MKQCHLQQPDGPRDYHTKWKKSEKQTNNTYHLHMESEIGHMNFIWFWGGTSEELACQCKRLKRCRFSFLGQEDSLEEGMATYSSILPEESHGQRSHGLRSVGLHRAEHDWSDLSGMHKFYLWKKQTHREQTCSQGEGNNCASYFLIPRCPSSTLFWSSSLLR